MYKNRRKKQIVKCKNKISHCGGHTPNKITEVYIITNMH